MPNTNSNHKSKKSNSRDKGYGTETKTRSSVGKAKVANLLVFGVALIGMFLPWLTVSYYGMTDSINAFTEKEYAPFSTVILVCIITTLGLTLLSMAVRSKGIKIFAGIVGLLGGATIIILTGLCLSANTAILKYASDDSGSGVGIYMTLLGALVGFITSIWLLAAKMESKDKKKR